MINYEEYSQIHYLRSKGISCRKITKFLSIDRRTVRKWEKKDCYQTRKRVARTSALDPYKFEIKCEIELNQSNATSIFKRLKKQGYSGGYTTVKKFVASLKKISAKKKWFCLVLGC